MITLMVMYVVSGLLLCGLAMPLMAGKIGPNGLYGFRVKATMENPQLWYAVNKYAGRRLLAAGIGGHEARRDFLFHHKAQRRREAAMKCLAIFAAKAAQGLRVRKLALAEVAEAHFLPQPAQDFGGALSPMGVPRAVPRARPRARRRPP